MIQSTEGHKQKVTKVTHEGNSQSRNESQELALKKITRIKIKKFRNNYACHSTVDGFHIGKWQKDEHLQFLQACEKHGNNWSKVRNSF
jgi:hypothetical protein